MSATKSTNGQAILIGLQDPKKHVYAGTVPYATTQRRRVKNRVARASRRINRQGS
jgi:hypothetical protein